MKSMSRLIVRVETSISFDNLAQLGNRFRRIFSWMCIIRSIGGRECNSDAIFGITGTLVGRIAPPVTANVKPGRVGCWTMDDSPKSDKLPPASETPQNCLATDFQHISIGKPQVFNQIVIHPLLGTVNGGPDYLTLNTAMDRSALTVTEVDEGGSVPELKVKTESSCRF